MTRGQSKRVLSAALGAALLAAPGCSCFQSRTQPVTIVPSDPRAAVYVNGEYAGRGTVVEQVRRGKSHAVMARVDDRAGTTQIGRKVSGTGMADIVGGIFFGVPFVGLLAPGFWSVDAEVVHVPLPPDPRPYARRAPERVAPEHVVPRAGEAAPAPHADDVAAANPQGGARGQRHGTAMTFDGRYYRPRPANAQAAR